MRAVLLVLIGLGVLGAVLLAGVVVGIPIGRRRSARARDLDARPVLEACSRLLRVDWLSSPTEAVRAQRELQYAVEAYEDRQRRHL